MSDDGDRLRAFADALCEGLRRLDFDGVEDPVAALSALDRSRLDAIVRLGVAAGFGGDARGSDARGTRSVAALERANEELRAANARLTRSWLGRHDAAAATATFHHERELAALRAELHARAARIDELTEVARRNDELYHQQLAWHDAPRYHAVDWLRDRLSAIPGLSALARGAWRAGAAIRRLLGRR